MPELWRTVAENDRYEVSNLGNVRNVKTGRILKPQRRSGYLAVALGHRNRRYVHHLVCIAWHGQRPEGMYACHCNDVKTDNRPENLYWGTPKQNTQDALRHDRMNTGEKCWQTNLTADDIREMRRLRADGMIYRDLGERFGIHLSTAAHICSGRSWGHIT